ncbi:MAG: ATP synthase F0 subunit A [Planctomycetes bacterium RBG_16_64_10]|nr:MAG: ATP synthase F0 subunit A [Planctomycetes bacterium RBG_16_64_10]
MADPLDPGHLFAHVQDAEYFQVPRWFPLADADGRIYLPQPFNPTGEPVAVIRTGFEPLDQNLEPLNLRITKFMVLELTAAILIAVTFIWLARRMRASDQPRGGLGNLLEAMVVFIREQVVRPAIGRVEGDRFLPFLLTMFFFVLVCNLLGLLPWSGSPTGSLAVTGALAVITLCTVFGAGMSRLGVLGYWRSQVPAMDLPWVLAIFLKPMIFVIEVVGILIKHFVLAIRLLANMLAGHLVLAVVVAFVAASFGGQYASLTWLGVTLASVGGAVALNLLELFVAFLQAFIFAFLSALFIGMAVHPH